MAQGIVPLAAHKRRIDRDPEDWVKLEIRLPPIEADRLAVVRAITGETYGRIILPAVRERLAGIRLPSIPEDLLTSIRGTPAPGKPEGSEAGQTETPAGCEAVPVGEDSPPPALEPTGGGEEGPRRPKKDPAKIKAMFGRKRAG